MIEALQKEGWLRVVLLFVVPAIGMFIWLEWLGLIPVFIIDGIITVYKRWNKWTKHPHDFLFCNLMTVWGLLLCGLFYFTPIHALWEIGIFLFFWVVVYSCKFTTLKEWLD